MGFKHGGNPRTASGTGALLITNDQAGDPLRMWRLACPAFTAGLHAVLLPPTWDMVASPLRGPRTGRRVTLNLPAAIAALSSAVVRVGRVFIGGVGCLEKILQGQGVGVNPCPGSWCAVQQVPQRWTHRSLPLPCSDRSGHPYGSWVGDDPSPRWCWPIRSGGWWGRMLGCRVPRGRVVWSEEILQAPPRPNRGDVCHLSDRHQITGFPCRSVTVPCSVSVAIDSRIWRICSPLLPWRSREMARVWVMIKKELGLVKEKS